MTKTLPFDLDEIARSLPPGPAGTRLPEGHRRYIEMCVGDFSRIARSRRPLMRGFADLTVSLSRTLKEGFGNLANWADSVIPDFDFAAVPEYAYATRSVGGHDASSVTSMSFEKPSDGCSLKVDLTVAPSGADIKARLLDDAGDDLHPFRLTVKDAESGETLLDNREFRTGAASIKGVKKGRYEMAAAADGAKCVFMLSVE